MSNQVTELFEKLWQNYTEVTPSAKQIMALFQDAQNKPVVNDHVAFRTFDDNKVNLEKLAAHFLAIGYKECGNYDFTEKHLVAKHFEHTDPSMPKVFISHLITANFSTEVQDILNKAVASVGEPAVAEQSILYSGRHWEINSKDHEILLNESEYAAWLYVWGFRANHFTVSINELEGFENIEDVNLELKNQGFSLNGAGGEVKGTPAQMLEQSSIMADKFEIEFTDTIKAVPSCFYEFAKRYKDQSDNLYTGFIAASANKIFESTNAVA